MTNVAHGSASFLAILNSDRQIVLANRSLIDAFGVSADDAIGRRPGELMGCRSADVGPDGCGTSPFCKTCGAAQAVGRTKLGSPQEKECRILRVNGDPLEMRITATPFVVDDEPFILFSAIDISDAKRRRSLERIFFHDIMNTATGVRGLSSMARTVTDEEQNEILELLESTSEHLIDEIQGQTELLATETNDFVVHPRTIESGVCAKVSPTSAPLMRLAWEGQSNSRRATATSPSSRTLYCCVESSTTSPRTPSKQPREVGSSRCRVAGLAKGSPSRFTSTASCPRLSNPGLPKALLHQGRRTRPRDARVPPACRTPSTGRGLLPEHRGRRYNVHGQPSTGDSRIVFSTPTLPTPVVFKAS